MTTEGYPAMKPAVKALWLSALLSKTYKQTRSYLRRDKKAAAYHGTPGYCCLGVLCDIAPVGGRWLNMNPEGYVPFNNKKGDGMPPNSVQRWAGINDMVADKLARLNDDGNNFQAIARWIDKNL